MCKLSSDFVSINASAGGHPHTRGTVQRDVYTQDGDTHSSFFVILQCIAIVFHGADVWMKVMVIKQSEYLAWI